MTVYSSSRRAARLFSLFLLAACLGCLSPHAGAQADTDSDDAGHGRILLVLPFDNLALAADAAPPSGSTAAASLDWVREAAPEILNSRFASSGFLPLTREDRLYALDHLGLPAGFQPSRATALRLAGTLDANDILFGSFSISGSGTSTTIAFHARIVDVAKLRLSEEITASGELSQLIPLLNSLAWKLTRKLDPSFSVAEETFRAADATLRIDAFEQFIRGLTENDSGEQLRHLKKATDLSPNFNEAWLATGKIQFANQQYEQAAISFGKVSHPLNSSDPAELEAGFYRGLSLLYSGGYAKAEESFAAVARVLPLAEVLNNQAVAISRRGRDATALFRQAEAADPTDPDYHFNLAVSLHRHGDKTETLAELAQYMKLRPGDSEAKAAEITWSSGAATDTTATEPLERIKRTYNGAAFRQAALMSDQVESARLQALPAAERAQHLNRAAREKLDHGLLLEAEREYQAALAADDHSAEAHAGVAQVRERSGDTAAARKEAMAALDRGANADAYLVLARLDLAANRLNEAHEEAAQAVRLSSPTDRAPRDLRKAIENRMDAAAGAKPATSPAANAPSQKPE